MNSKTSLKETSNAVSTIPTKVSTISEPAIPISAVSTSAAPADAVKSNIPKMVKFVDDLCYGQTYSNDHSHCQCCWIKVSCEANFKSQQKKKMMAKRGKVPKVREKLYKKTDKYREW